MESISHPSRLKPSKYQHGIETLSEQISASHGIFTIKQLAVESQKHHFEDTIINCILIPMDYEWHGLCDNKYRYMTASFSENSFGKRFNRLNHEYMLISVAAYGGPIAVTSDKTKILTLREDDPSLQNICIFTNDGELAHRIPLVNPFQNIIAVFAFVQDEFLLVIFQKGQQWLVDPYKPDHINKQKLMGLLESETIIEGKIFENGYVVLTNLRRFLFVRHYEQPQCIEFLSCEQELKEQKEKNPDQSLYWTVFAPRLIISERVELHMAHPTAGIMQVIENQGKRYFLNHEKAGHLIESKLPHIPGIKYISNMSPNKKLIAYFSAEPLYKESPIDQNLKKKKGEKGEKEPPRIPYGYAYRVIIAPSINSETIEANRFKFIEMGFVKDGVHINNKSSSQKISMKWCGSKAIIVQFQNNELYMLSVEGDYIRIEKDRGEKQKWSYLQEQVDGTRILSKRDNKILRQIPSSYISVFETFSQEPGGLLYAAYEAFEDKAPLQDDQIRREKEKLAKAVEQCTESSRFQLKFEVINKLLKAATYGKAFLPPNMVSNNTIHETSKALRIVHHLRQQLRYITFEQFQSLPDDQLLKILLRNREHYLAFQIYNYLKKDQSFRVKIYTDWACCKVASLDGTEEEICRQIRMKLENETGISFTEIAHRSIEINRSELAMKLLQYEPSISKKVPLLLWIGSRENDNYLKFYQKAVEEALRSREVNLLYLVIKKMLSSEKITTFEVQEMLSRSKEGEYALKNYYRMFDGLALIKYLTNLQHHEGVLLEEMRMAVIDRKYENKQRLFQLVSEKFKDFESNLQIQWRRPTFEKLFKHFCQFTQFNPTVKFTSDKIKPITLSKQLDVFMSKGDSDAINDMKDEYKLSQKRVALARIKVLLQTGKWEDLLAFVEKYQKKCDIPVEMIADQLLQKNEPAWGLKMIARMPEKQKDQQYLLLQRIGKIKEAIDLAADRKDAKALELISETLLDPTLVAHLNEKLSLLRRR